MQPTNKPEITIVDDDLEHLEAHISNLRICVAEDNKTNQLLIKKMLGTKVKSLEISDNGQIAVDRFRNAKPDIVLMDVSMPIKDGLTATAEIRVLETAHKLNKCPIIALTANAMPEDRARCFDTGMNDFITKPVRKKNLFNMIGALTGFDPSHSKGQ